MLNKAYLILVFIAILISPLLGQDVVFDNVIFLHRSSGYGLTNNGHVRDSINAYNDRHGTQIEFWDHYTSDVGIHDQLLRNYNWYNPPGGNNGYTDIEWLDELFHQPLHNPPDNAFSRIMLSHSMTTRDGQYTVDVTHDVIAFKSCFTESGIYSDAELQRYQNTYLRLRDVMDDHPEKIFICMGFIPRLMDGVFPPEWVARDLAFHEWLESPAFLEGHPNIFVYNIWWDLAEHNPASPYYNYLKHEYESNYGGPDNHPNLIANEYCGPRFTAAIINAIQSYQNGAIDNIPPAPVGDLEAAD